MGASAFHAGRATSSDCAVAVIAVVRSTMRGSADARLRAFAVTRFFGADRIDAPAAFSRRHANSGNRGFALLGLRPQAEAADKRIGVVAGREPGGSVLSFVTLPPPSTTSSGSSATLSRATTSATYLRHFFLPYRSRPRNPT